MNKVEAFTLGAVIGLFIFMCVVGLIAWSDERRKYRQ